MSIVIFNSFKCFIVIRIMNIWVGYYSWVKFFFEEKIWNKNVIFDFDIRSCNLILVSWCDKFEDRKFRRIIVVVCKDKNVTIRGVILNLR